MFFTVVSYILVLALGGAIGATIVSWQSVREAEKMAKSYKQSMKIKDSLLDMSMKNTKYFENRCEQLEAELNYYKNGGDSKYGIDIQ